MNETYLNNLKGLFGEDKVKKALGYYDAVSKQVTVAKNDAEIAALYKTDPSFRGGLHRLLQGAFEGQVTREGIPVAIDYQPFGMMPKLEDDEDRLELELNETVQSLRKLLDRNLVRRITQDLVVTLARLEKLLGIKFGTDEPNGVLLAGFSTEAQGGGDYNLMDNVIRISHSALDALKTETTGSDLLHLIKKLTGTTAHEAVHAFRNVHHNASMMASFPLAEMAKDLEPRREDFSDDSVGEDAYWKAMDQWAVEYYFLIPHELEAYQLMVGLEHHRFQIFTTVAEALIFFLSPETETKSESINGMEDIVSAFETSCENLNRFSKVMLGHQEIKYEPHPQEIATLVSSEGNPDTINMEQLKILVRELSTNLIQQVETFDGQAPKRQVQNWQHRIKESHDNLRFFAHFT